MNRRDQREGDQATRPVSYGFLPTAFCRLPFSSSVSL